MLHAFARPHDPLAIWRAIAVELVARTGVLEKSVATCPDNCTTKVRLLELDESLSRKSAES